METYKFKMGRGPNAEVLYEHSDGAAFVAWVRKKVSEVPSGLSVSNNFGPVVETPEGEEISGLRLQRWLLNSL